MLISKLMNLKTAVLLVLVIMMWPGRTERSLRNTSTATYERHRDTGVWDRCRPRVLCGMLDAATSRSAFVIMIICGTHSSKLRTEEDPTLDAPASSSPRKKFKGAPYATRTSDERSTGGKYGRLQRLE